jgi:Anti-sigma-K factor rskA
MNINDYISSGILEQYVSGTATPQERQEVECMSHIYPEIHTELLTVQHAIEAYAQAQAITPPKHLRQNIFDAIAAIENEKEATPLKTISNKTSINDDVEKNIEPKLTFTKNKNFRSAAAILFLISAGLGYLLFNTNKQSNQFANDLALVQAQIKSNTTIIENNKTEIAVLQNKEFMAVEMKGIPTKSPDSKAIIYWNKSSQEVFVSVNKLPVPIKGKQYQLWAIADGKPIDLGMIANNTDMEIAFQKMKTIKNPSAFAVTLEKEGGVTSPTMTEMYVMGGV